MTLKANLIGAPIPHGGDGEAKGYAWPGQRSIVGWSEEVGTVFCRHATHCVIITGVSVNQRSIWVQANPGFGGVGVGIEELFYHYCIPSYSEKA